MRLRQELGPFPVWVWAVIVLAGWWYLGQLRRGHIRRSSRPLLLEAFDEPRERADLVRGVVTGLVAGVVSFYLLKRTHLIGGK